MKTLLLLTATLLSASSAYAQCPYNDSVGSLDLFNPTPIPPGAIHYDDLVLFGVWQGATSGVELDAFSIEVAPGRTVEIDTAYDFAELALYLQLYTPAASFIQGTDPNDQVAFMSYTNTMSTSQTVVLLALSAATPNACGDYSLSIRNDACPGDDVLEDFDSCQSSYSLSDPSLFTLQQLAILDGDDDWFDVQLQDGESLDVSIFFEHARADVDLAIYDWNGSNCGGPALVSSTSVTNDESIFYTNTTGGFQDIAIQVTFYGSSAGNSCNDYELAYDIVGPSPDDQFEDNDTICTPSSIDQGVFNDLIVKENDADYYSFQIFNNERATLAIDFDHADGDLDLNLWDVSAGCGNAVLAASSGSVSNYEEVEFTSTAPGFTSYILEVYHYPSSSGSGENDYDLTVGFARAGELGEVVCSNNPNSTGLQSYTYGTGSVSVASNNLTLNTQDLPLNAVGFYNTSRAYGVVMNPAGSQGNICIAGAAIGRYRGPGQIMTSGTTGTMALTLDLTSMPQPTGSVAAVPGDTWFFQLWHRDAVGGSAVSNFSTALRVRMQ